MINGHASVALFKLIETSLELDFPQVPYAYTVPPPHPREIAVY